MDQLKFSQINQFKLSFKMGQDQTCLHKDTGVFWHLFWINFDPPIKMDNIFDQI